MEEHAGKLWFGICAGRTVPSARLALAGTRITALDKTNTVMECFMDPSVAKNPDPVWAACHAMDMTLTGPRIPEDVVPSLPQAIWVEFMGIDEKPDSDDYEIAVDLVAGDFYYSPNLKDDGNRKGFALCVQHLTDYIASQMDEKKSHDRTGKHARHGRRYPRPHDHEMRGIHDATEDPDTGHTGGDPPAGLQRRSDRRGHEREGTQLPYGHAGRNVPIIGNDETMDGSAQGPGIRRDRKNRTRQSRPDWPERRTRPAPSSDTSY